METSTLKIAVIGAGNMGGAIARGIASGSFSFAADVRVSDISEQNLEALKAFSPAIETTTSNVEVIKNADIIILAVKPWLVEKVADEIRGKINYKKQMVVSVAAGVDINTLSFQLDEDATLFRVIPNTAIDVKQSVSIISAYQATEAQLAVISEIFGGLGKVFIVPESQLNAYMSLSSCGIAYAFRYIRAAMEGAVEMGIPAQTAKEVVIQTLRGAIELLEKNNTHPEVEVDKVTTPGGITIKGLNEMEANGFTNAVIKGLKASHIK